MAPTPKQTKRPRKVLSLKEKIDIIKSLEGGVTVESLKTKYGIGISTIYDIRTNKEKIINFYAKADSLVKMKNRKTVRSSKNPSVEEALYIWFRQNRNAGVPISGPMILEKAKFFHERLKIETECVYSRGWLDKFKNRYGIRCVNTPGDQQSSDKVSATLFVEELAEMIEKENLSPEVIYNADETGVFWRSIPRKTLVCHDEPKPSGSKDSKERLTVLICSNAAGMHKCKLFVIGKYAKPRALKGISNLPVIYTANRRAWMTQELMAQWYKKHFIKEAREHVKKSSLPPDNKILLLLDNCPAHPPAKDLEIDEIIVKYLPPNCTSLIQPMDQGVIKSLKCHYRNNQLKTLLRRDSSGDITDMIKAFTIKDFIYSLNTAWLEVQPSVLKNSWKNILPELLSENINTETIDNHENCLEQIVHTADVLDNFNLQNIEAWVNEDSEAATFASLNDEEILVEVTKPEELSELSEDSDSNSGIEIISNNLTLSQAITNLQELIDFLGNKDYVSNQDVMLMELIKDKLLHEKSKFIKQTTINQYFTNS